MNADALDMLIEKLEAIMPAAPDPLGLSVVLHDWRPVWNLAKEIQEPFNSGIRYPTKELRQRAWLRFNALHDEASRRALASAPICEASHSGSEIASSQTVEVSATLILWTRCF
jgi:hypothetical protein